jgi:FtsH-binding integral membrane protein
LRLTRSVALMVVGLLMAIASGVLVMFGLREFASIIGVSGIIIFSVGMILWHTEP